MTSEKRNNLIYWAPTLLVLLPTGVSGIFELFFEAPASVVQSMHTLGYPLYLLKILGFAKIMGSLAIIWGKYPRLKEWAYAGFTFDFLGAAASHVLANDAAHAPAPLVMLALLLASYVVWYKAQTAAH